MVKKIFTLIFLFYSSISFAQKEDILFGLIVPVDDTLYTTKTEISNVNYYEYLYYVQRDSSKEFFESQLIKIISTDTIFTDEKYFNSPEKRFYPVLYVNHQQAVNYCEWLEDVLIQKMIANEAINEDQYYLDVRLPTIEEWIKMAKKYNYVLEKTDWKKNDYTSPIKKSDLKKIIKNNNLALNKRKYNEKLKEFMKENPVFMNENLNYTGNKDDLKYALNFEQPWGREDHDALLNIPYDLRGNLSEMTSTEGIAKGGNWKSAPNDIGIMDSVKYQNSSNTIGFRCFCEFKEQ